MLPAHRDTIRCQLYPLSAAAVFAGLGARADRRELEASVGGPTQAELPRLEALADDLLPELEQFDEPGAAVRLLAGIVEGTVSEPAVPGEGTCLILALLVTDLHLRDLAWALITPANAEDHVRLWVRWRGCRRRWRRLRCAYWAWPRG